MGPFWLTGGGFGLEGSWLAFVVLLILLPVVYAATRDLDYQYNALEIVPGGIPVDIDAAARRQHETAMGAGQPAEAREPALVQILPLPGAPLGFKDESAPAGEPPANSEPESGNETTQG